MAYGHALASKGRVLCAAATMRRTEAGSDGVKPLALSLVAAIVALSALAASPGRAHPGHRHPDGVAEFGLRFRTSTMQALSIHMGLLAAEKKGDIELVADDRRVHGQAVRTLSALLVDLFQHDTSARTRAKAEIWTEWDRFAAMTEDLETAANKLAEATVGRERAAIDAAIEAVGAACGACHKAFRKPRRRR